MLGNARQFIRQRRRAAPLKLLATLSEKYLRAWYNDGFFVFDRNGESFAIRAFAQWNKGAPVSIWDVGAHEGEWAREIHSLIPGAQVVSFEILKPIAERIPPADWLQIENLGMSDREGEVSVMWNHSFDSTNSITPRMTNQWFEGANLEEMTCRVSTIDLYRSGKTPPALLKIDTEGHEKAVLDGARGLLSGPDAPVMIQFEYGDTWLMSGSTLHYVQTLLESYGYSVGRLFPDHVQFKAYDCADDHFRMGNMIAVKDGRLKAMLAD